METVTTLPRPQGLTRADLDAMPDDGRRYELIDGVIVVSAAPSPRHQDIVASLYVLLKGACPRELKLLFAPIDVALAEDSVMQPDLVLARRTDFTAKELPAAPVLAIEVLSPSTRQQDLLVKRERFERAGCPSYWVVDPGGRTPPSIIAWELDDGTYVEVGRATGDVVWHAAQPFAVDIVPNLLLDD